MHQLIHQLLQNLPVGAARIVYSLGVLVGHPQNVHVANDLR